MPIRLVALADIDLDGSPHTRYTLHPDVIEEYGEVMKSKKSKMPEVKLWKSPKHNLYYVSDGLHRIHGAHAAGLTHIAAMVLNGTWADCLKDACQQNLTHGLRRSVEDKRCLVETVLMNGGDKWTNDAIAELTHVSRPTVIKIRELLEEHNTIKPAPVRTNTEGEKKTVSVSKEEKDRTGTVIPKDLHPLWSRRKEPSRLIKILDGLRQEMYLAHQSEDALYAEVDFNALAADLQKIVVNLKLAIPWAVCTQCQGRLEVQPDKKCPMCKGRGMISQFRYDHCSPEEIKAIREKSNEAP